MPRPFTSYILAPSWSANQPKLHMCEGATHCFISHILGFSWAEGGKIQVGPGWLSTNVRAELLFPAVFLESVPLLLSPMTDLGTYSWKKTPSGKHQGHILAQKGPELQSASDWRFAGGFWGKHDCMLELFFFFYFQHLLPITLRGSIYGDLVWTAFSCAEHAKVERKEDWFVLS